MDRPVIPSGVTIADIMAATCVEFHVTLGEFGGHGQGPRHARAAAAYLCRLNRDWTLREIAGAFGRSQSSVYNGAELVRQFAERDNPTREELDGRSKLIRIVAMATETAKARALSEALRQEAARKNAAQAGTPSTATEGPSL